MKTIEITDQNFKEIVGQSDVPVVIEFFAPWCGPCNKMVPIFEEIAQEYGDFAKICRCDVDQAPKATKEAGIQSVPFILFYKDGMVVDQNIGMTLKSVITEKLDKVINM